MIIQSLPINIGRDADGNDIASTYATKSEIPTKVSDLTNDSGFVNDLSSYYTKSETDTLLDGKSETTHNHDSAYLGITAKAESAKSADSVAWTNVSGKPSTYTPSSHTHDDRYYTESEVDTKLGEKANADHTHSEYLTGITKTMVTTALGYTPPTSDTHWTTTLYAGAKDAKSNAVTTNGNTYIKLYDNNTVRSQLNIKGSGATSVTTDANGVITISSTDNNTTYSNMTAATADAAGTAGLVPAPAAGKQTSFLRGDGTWVVPTNTTYASMSAAEATTGTATTARSITAKVLNDKINEKIATKANSSEVYHYGVCSTAAATAAKVVSITDFVLKTGVTVFVKFTVNNTATNNTLTLNVNSTGAKKIYWRGAQTFSAGYIGGNRVIGFVYDGTNWEIIGELDTSTSVIQTATTTNATYPILMSDLANATANRTSGVRFGSGVKINPKTNTIYATTFNGDVDFPITEAEIEAIFNGNS